MILTAKQKLSLINREMVPPAMDTELNLILKETDNLEDEQAMAFFEPNFNKLFDSLMKNHPEALNRKAVTENKAFIVNPKNT